MLHHMLRAAAGRVHLPGPSALVAGPNSAGIGYYGTVDAADFITGDQLASILGVTQGTGQNSSTPWHKLLVTADSEVNNEGGQAYIMYFPQRPIRNGLSWAHLYSNGLIYGSDSSGTTPGSPEVNQLRYITIGDVDLKVKVTKNTDADPYTSFPFYTELGATFYYMLDSYSGSDKLADYASEDFLDQVPNGNYTWAQAARSSDLSYRAMLGTNSTPRGNASSGSTNTSTFNGWRPVLVYML